MDHELILTSFPYFSSPHDLWRARCTCGRYDSGKVGTEKAARQQWLQHYSANTSPPPTPP